MDINYLLFLQSIRESSELLTGIFNFITHLGGSTLAIVFVAVMYWCIDKRTGVRIGLSVAAGGIINQLAKNIMCINRPWIKDSRVVPDPVALKGATGYSFPSGHSQTAMSVYGTIAASSKRRAVSCFFWILALLIGFSRNFLGVHTPQDVLTGLAIGFVSIYISGRILDWAEDGAERDRTIAVIMLILTAAFLVFVSMKPYPVVMSGDELLVDPDEMIEDCYKIGGVLAGIAVGWPLERRHVRFTTCVTAKIRIIRAAAGIPCVAILSILTKKLTAPLGLWACGFAESFVPVLFVILLWPLIFTALERKRQILE